MRSSTWETCLAVRWATRETTGRWGGSSLSLPLPLANLLESREFGEPLCRAVENHSGNSGPGNWLSSSPVLSLPPAVHSAGYDDWLFQLLSGWFPSPPALLPRLGFVFSFPPNALFHQNLIGWMFQEPRNIEKEGIISKGGRGPGIEHRYPLVDYVLEPQEQGPSQSGGGGYACVML